MMLSNSQRRVRQGGKHQSMLGDQPDVIFRAVKLHRFHAGQTIGKAKLHIVLLNHLTEEESTRTESLHNHSSRIFCSLPWGDLEIDGSTVTNEWNCTVSPYQNKLNEVPSSIGVTIVPITMLDFLRVEDVRRFESQTCSFLRHHNVKTLITSRARERVTACLLNDKNQTYVRAQCINHWWDFVNCETLSLLLNKYYGVQWKYSNGTIQEAVMNIKFSLSYADSSLEENMIDAHYDLIEIYERKYGPLCKHVEAAIADMIEARLPPDSQLSKDFKKKKSESLRQGIPETIQLCCDRLLLCMADARTSIRQGQLYGPPDRVICHHYQSGKNSFWSEGQRPEIKLIELAKTAKSDQKDVPVAYVSVFNVLAPKGNDSMCRKKEELGRKFVFELAQEERRNDRRKNDSNFNSKREVERMEEARYNLEKKEENERDALNRRRENDKKRDRETRKREEEEEEERKRLKNQHVYICNTCGGRNHQRRNCRYNGHRQTNNTNLRWIDSPAGQRWHENGYSSFNCHTSLPESDNDNENDNDNQNENSPEPEIHSPEELSDNYADNYYYGGYYSDDSHGDH